MCKHLCIAVLGRRIAVFTIVVLAPFVSLEVQAKKPGPIGSITTWAQLPPLPGFPEGVAVHGNRVFISGPARFGTAGSGPSAIHVFDRNSHQLETTILVTGEALAFEHAVSNVAVDGDGRVYAISTQLGILRFTKHGGSYVQQVYGQPLPDLPRAADVGPGVPSSPTIIDFPPLPNDLVFDDDGNLYVTDSLQATIFRYAPGGGVPQIWFQSPLFQGGGFIPFGTNGIRLDPASLFAYIVSTSSLADPGLGTIYRLPLVAAPDPGDLEVFHEFDLGKGPDQLAFGNDGELYVSLAFANQISVLGWGGIELTRFSSAPGDSIPMDLPAGIAFDTKTKSLLIANHALLSGNPLHFAVLSLYVGDPGDELSKPELP